MNATVVTTVVTTHLLTKTHQSFADILSESTTAHKHLFAFLNGTILPPSMALMSCDNGSKFVQQDLAHLSPGPTVDPANWSINSPSLWSTDSSSMGTKRSPPRLRASCAAARRKTNGTSVTSIDILDGKRSESWMGMELHRCLASIYVAMLWYHRAYQQKAQCLQSLRLESEPCLKPVRFPVVLVDL